MLRVAADEDKGGTVCARVFTEAVGRSILVGLTLMRRSRVSPH